MVPDYNPIFSGEERDRLTSISINKEDIATKSSGSDDFFPRVLKECKFEICEQLTEVFSKSADIEFMPIYWAQANVVAVFKKGDKSSVHKYRPISLTSVIGKMLESLIANSIRNI